MQFSRNIQSIRGQLTLGVCLSLLCLSFNGHAQESPVVEPVSAGAVADSETSTEGEAAAPEDPEAGCFPPCRAGYLCYEGKCIEACNPPCRKDEKCTAEGDCVPRAASVTEPTPAPTPVVEAEPESVQPPVLESVAPPVKRKPRLGGMVGIAGVASLCVTENGCNTSEKDWGAGAALMGGFRVLPWLLVDAQVGFAYLILAGSEENEDPSGVTFTLNAGATFLPLKRSRMVEPVFGLHLGYALGWTKFKLNNSTYKTKDHGVSLEYMVGIDFNVSHYVTLGLHLVVQEPLYVTSCSSVTAYGSSPAESSCAEFKGDRTQFFFNPQLELRVYF